MIHYHFDRNRIYTHFSESSQYAPIPENTTTVKPPELTGDEVAQWGGRDDGWVVLPEYPQKSIAALRSGLKERATSIRWRKMTGGLTLPGDIKVGTTIDDQNRITSVVANAELAGLTDADEVDFKSLSGWVRITIGEIKQIAGTIGQFVQACYTAERTHHEAIDAIEDRESLDDYDISSGWPVYIDEP